MVILMEILLLLQCVEHSNGSRLANKRYAKMLIGVMASNRALDHLNSFRMLNDRSQNECKQRSRMRTSAAGIPSNVDDKTMGKYCFCWRYGLIGFFGEFNLCSLNRARCSRAVQQQVQDVRIHSIWFHLTLKTK